MKEAIALATEIRELLRELIAELRHARGVGR